MQTDNLYTKEQAREKLVAGIRKCADAVGITMGTAGSNSIIESPMMPGHLTTNDGSTILNAIKLADPLEDMGRKILLEAVSRANKQSGDGSSTTCVLTAAIIEQGLKSDASPQDIKRSLEACIPLVEEIVKKQAREIEIDQVAGVASISAEDEQIGATIQEIYQQIGKDGIIYWDVSKTDKDTYTVGTGITVEGAGYASPYMCDLDEKTGQLLSAARWKNPSVLIAKEKITTAAIFEKLFIQLNGQGKKEVVIFCDDYEPTVIPQLVQTRVVQGFKTVLVKMPVLWKDEWYEDLARASGATVIDPTVGLGLKDAEPKHLGTFGHITIDKNNCYIDGIADLTDHAKELMEKPDDASKVRAGRLNTKTARYFVGAHSDSALSYRRLKVEDAISASWQALHGGVVAGGGVALRNATEVMPDTVGGSILKVALLAPMVQIKENAQIDYLLTVASSKENNFGFDTRTKEIVDMFESNITDPANIVINAAKQAISVAAAVLAVETVVTLPHQEMAQQSPII